MSLAEKHLRRVACVAVFWALGCSGAAQADALSRAAQSGRAQAQYALALRYEEGAGAPQNLDLALWWYRRAALQGHAAAQNNLGALYYEQGNFQQALHWYQRAAHKGNANAQFNLALMHELGRGVPKNPEKAQYWYQLAAAQGHWNAQYNLARLFDDDLPPLPASP